METTSIGTIILDERNCVVTQEHRKILDDRYIVRRFVHPENKG